MVYAGTTAIGDDVTEGSEASLEHASTGLPSADLPIRRKVDASGRQICETNDLVWSHGFQTSSRQMSKYKRYPTLPILPTRISSSFPSSLIARIAYPRMAQVRDVEEWTLPLDFDTLELWATTGTQRRAFRLPILRPVSLRPITASMISRRLNAREAFIDALLVYSRGQVAETPCSCCQQRYSGTKPFRDCVLLQGFWDSACAACIVRGDRDECSFVVIDTPSALEKLPVEILHMIIRTLIPSGERIAVQYLSYRHGNIQALESNISLRQSIEEAERLMLVNQFIGSIATKLLYGYNTFSFDSDPENDLPLFLQNLRDETFSSIRHVAIEWPPCGSMVRGLDLLLGCHQLSSLEIDNSYFPINKWHKAVLECFRLNTFNCMESDGWLDKVKGIITSGDPLSYQQKKRRETTRSKKLSAWKDGYYLWKCRGSRI